MSSGLTARETRVFNPRPRRHHRPTYSLLEVRLGLAVLALLAVIAGWVAWAGAHPDPTLLGEVAALEPPAPVVARGALPTDLAKGFREGALAHFEAKNLYEKIDGRADFFLSRGFVSLTFLSLVAERNPAKTLDIELYDMGSPENALGAFSAEKPVETAATEGDGSQWYVSRNALFLARGSVYVRVVGADESAEIESGLRLVRATLEQKLAAGERPWSHALFADALELRADRISIERENAFSFGFARNVHIGLLADGQTELFVTPAADPTQARALARQFEEGFLSYGERETRAGVLWIKDRYLGSYTRVAAEGAMVLGVRGASEVEAAAAALDKLRGAVARLPAEGVARAALPLAGEASKGPSHE